MQRDYRVAHIPDYDHEEVATHTMALLRQYWLVGYCLDHSYRYEKYALQMTEIYDIIGMTIRSIDRAMTHREY